MNLYIKMYLNKNLGDDLMLIKFVEYFNEYNIYVDCQVIYAGYYDELLKEYSNIILIQCPLRKIEKVFGKGFFKCIVLLGGSVLQGNKYSGCWYRFLNCLHFKKYKKNGTRYAIIGCNTGPFKNNFMRYFVKLELNKADLITTRDTDSFEFIKNVTRSKKTPIHYFPDILFCLSNRDNDFDKNNKVLGISVHGPTKEKTSQFLANVCNEYLLNDGEKIKLFCFETGLNNNDKDAAEIIKSMVIKRDCVELICNENNMKEFINNFISCERIIAVRFHASIIATAFNMPFISISYSNKTKNYMSDIKCIDKNISIDVLDKTPEKDFLYLLNHNPAMPNMNFKKNHEGHFDVLNKYLVQLDKED